MNVPRAIQVIRSDLTAPDKPTVIVTGGRNIGVDAIRECWEIDDEWWRNRIARKYYDVVLKGGKHVVLFENTLQRTWFMQDP